jgi:nucleotide-binding universal stress UspA family protein
VAVDTDLGHTVDADLGLIAGEPARVFNTSAVVPVNMYETILLPTDGSAPSEAAREHAIGLAAAYDATLHAIYVIDDKALRAARADSDVVLAGFEEQGTSLVGDVASAAADAGVACETAVLHGHPHEVITDYADEHGIDLVVMGTHGRHGVQRFLLGSVTERVVRSSAVPVLTVRGEKRTGAEADAETETETDGGSDTPGGA